MTHPLDLAERARSPKQAARYYRQALDLAAPGSADHMAAGEGLGQALEKIDVGQAIAHYQAIIASDAAGVHHYAYERLAIKAEKAGDYGLALETIQTAARRYVPTGVTERRRAWRIADKAGLLRPLLPCRLYLSQVEYSDRLTELLWYWAELARDRKAWERAARRYGRITVDSARYDMAQTQLGHCLEKLKRIEEALAAYERAARRYEAGYKTDPIYAYVGRKPFDRLIILYERRKDTQTAFDWVQRALAIVRQCPPKTWWARAERVALAAGGSVDREAWEAGFVPPSDRVAHCNDPHAQVAAPVCKNGGKGEPPPEPEGNRRKRCKIGWTSWTVRVR